MHPVPDYSESVDEPLLPNLKYYKGKLGNNPIEMILINSRNNNTKGEGQYLYSNNGAAFYVESKMFAADSILITRSGLVDSKKFTLEIKEQFFGKINEDKITGIWKKGDTQLDFELTEQINSQEDVLFFINTTLKIPMFASKDNDIVSRFDEFIYSDFNTFYLKTLIEDAAITNQTVHITVETLINRSKGTKVKIRSSIDNYTEDKGYDQPSYENSKFTLNYSIIENGEIIEKEISENYNTTYNIWVFHDFIILYPRQLYFTSKSPSTILYKWSEKDQEYELYE